MALSAMEHAALFKKDSRAVKTSMLSDIAAVIADQGSCEIAVQPRRADPN